VTDWLQAIEALEGVSAATLDGRSVRVTMTPSADTEEVRAAVQAILERRHLPGPPPPAAAAAAAPPLPPLDVRRLSTIETDDAAVVALTVGARTIEKTCRPTDLGIAQAIADLLAEMVGSIPVGVIAVDYPSGGIVTVVVEDPRGARKAGSSERSGIGGLALARALVRAMRT